MLLDEESREPECLYNLSSSFDRRYFSLNQSGEPTDQHCFPYSRAASVANKNEPRRAIFYSWVTFPTDQLVRQWAELMVLFHPSLLR